MEVSIVKSLDELKTKTEWIDLLYKTKILDILEEKKKLNSLENNNNNSNNNGNNSLSNLRGESLTERNMSSNNDNQILSFSAHHTNVGDALRLLSQYHLFAAPVFNENEDNTENTKLYNYMGMLGVYEIVSYLLGFYKERRKVNSVVGVIQLDTWIESKSKIVENSEFFKITPVIDILKLSRHHPQTPTQLYTNDNLAILIRTLSKADTLRLPVIENDQIIGVTSTSDILRIIVENEDKLPSIFQNSIESLSAKFNLIEDCTTVTSDTPTAIAFDKLERENKPSLLVVDSKTKNILVNFSLSDLKVLVQHNIEDLLLPISEFLRMYKPIQKLSPISVEKRETLLKMIKLMVVSKIHSIYIQNDILESNMIGVITFKKIIHLLHQIVMFTNQTD